MSLNSVTRWMRWLHIYTAAPVLALMLLFAVTGLLLNHNDWSLGTTEQHQHEFELPQELLEQNWGEGSTETTLSLLLWLEKNHGIRGVDIEIEWETEEELVIVTLEGPHGAYSVEAYPSEGIVEVFQRQLPVLEMLNNLHRGKHVTGLWRLLTDISAIFMVLFCLSGFWLVLINRAQRVPASGWISLGLALMAMAIYLMH